MAEPVVGEEEMAADDVVDAVEALYRWFESQDIGDGEAIATMVAAMALILHRRCRKRQARAAAAAVGKTLEEMVKDLNRARSNGFRAAPGEAPAAGSGNDR